MHHTSKGVKKVKNSSLVVDDTLKERSTDSPQFAAKIDKATRIMSLVRAEQAKGQTTQ